MDTTTRRERKSPTVRTAVLVAAAVEVQCPECGEPQPNPDDGSFLWSHFLVAQAIGTRTCTACDQPLRVTTSNKVAFI